MNTIKKLKYLFYICTTIVCTGIFFYGWLGLIFLPLPLYFFLASNTQIEKVVKTIVDNDHVVWNEDNNVFYVSSALNETDQDHVKSVYTSYLIVKGNYLRVSLGRAEISNDQYCEVKKMLGEKKELRALITQNNLIDDYTFSIIKARYGDFVDLDKKMAKDNVLTVKRYEN